MQGKLKKNASVYRHKEMFVTGYGTHFTKHPHHRPSIAKKETFNGMLAGGTNIGKQDEVAQMELANIPVAKCYIDDSESFSTNEVDIYWNSELVCAMAKLGLIGSTS